MSVWYPWLYQYGVGGVIFVVSVVLLLRSGALNLRHLPHRFLLGALIAGLLGFAAFHAFWISQAAGA